MTAPEWDIAVTRSDRTESLFTGAVGVGSLPVRWLSPPINEMFTRMLRGGDFAAAEMSLTYAMMATDMGAPPLVTLPVFLDRTFRHRDIYVRSDGRIDGPRDLVGRPFALPDFYSSDGLWIRGMLRDGYGVEPRDVRWVQFRAEKRLDRFPDTGYPLVDEPGASAEDLLRTGRADAIFVPTPPAAFRQGAPWIRRLIGDPEPVERAYHSRTGIFPITHTLVMRRDLYQAYPRGAVSIYDVFLRARDDWVEKEEDNGPAKWEEIEPDLWPYGVTRNRTVLEKAVEYAVGDGLIGRTYEPEELFVTELRST